MITKEEIFNFCYYIPRNENNHCAWAISLELANNFKSLTEPITIGNEEMADRIGYKKRSVIRAKPLLLAEGYWEVVTSNNGSPSSYVPTAKLINAIEGENNV